MWSIHSISNVLLRLVILCWMTSLLSSARKSPTLDRFPFHFSYFWKADLTAFEDMWSRKVGIKTNLKKGMMFRFTHLLPSSWCLAPFRAFQEDIIERIQQNAPARRVNLKITDRDSCKLAFGYVLFGVIFFVSNLVWELYRLDCCSVADVIMNHPISQRISGTSSIPYELCSCRDGSTVG
jgi:hypothetical protein